MNGNNSSQTTSISHARTLEEIGEFWDTHSLADYWDQTAEVEFEVRAERRRRITLDPEIYATRNASACPWTYAGNISEFMGRRTPAKNRVMYSQLSSD